VFAYAYDNYRMSSVTLPAASSGGTTPVVSYGYHSTLGTLQSVTHSANGSLTYGYDAATRGTLPLSETWSVSDSEGATLTTRSVSQTYDEFARIGSFTVDDGPTLTTTYDGDGLVTGVGPLTITRDTTAGAELGTSIGTSPAVVTTTQLYDAYGAVTTRGATYGASGLSFAYTYDDFGRLRSVLENDNGTVVTTWYTYDNAGRLFRVCSTATCLASDGVTSTASETYVYDANGNRTSWLTTGAANSANVTATSVDAQDRLLSFTSSAGDSTYTYDALGRLATKTTPAMCRR
jgi:YD repeat-containing protein